MQSCSFLAAARSRAERTNEPISSLLGGSGNQIVGLMHMTELNCRRSVRSRGRCTLPKNAECSRILRIDSDGVRERIEP